MEPILGVTFAPFARKHSLHAAEARTSLQTMLRHTHANYVVFVPNALQDTPQSETIDWQSDATVCDDELCEIIAYAKTLGLRVALKPTVNCRNGTWRAHINFFDEDVPCEPKWGNWFASYAAFQAHYATLAQTTGCDLLITGCEMVQSERREAEWRAVIAEVRRFFSGPVTYNTDKYQEHNLKWWDALDIISSSGYYPMHDWERQLDRIEAVVKRFQKPFFFAECGCMSTVGSNLTPNDCSLRGATDLQGQADWYHAMFSACRQRDWVNGYAIWAWNHKPAPLPERNRDYDLFGKPAEKVVAAFYAASK